MSHKSNEWDVFARGVKEHVLNYAQKQYGDYGDEGELLGRMTADECMELVRKYVARYGKGARGETEQLRDLLKIAHLAGAAYMRRSGLKMVDSPT